MSHVYENMSMTFNELIELFDAVSSGKIEASEKVDGQNLYFTYDHTSGQAMFARNAGHWKVGGITREAMTADFIHKGKGKPEYDAVIKTFDDGMDTIQGALRNIDQAVLDAIFYKPGVYVNTEIMSGDNRNIIVYNGNFIVLHGIDILESGEPQELSPAEIAKVDIAARQAFKLLKNEVENQEANIAKENWEVVGPRLVQLQNLSDGDFIERVEQAIDGILGGTGLGLQNTFKDFVSYHLANVIRETFKEPISQEAFDQILTLVTETSDEKKQRTEVITLRSLKKLHPHDEDKVALGNVAKSTTVKKVLGIILEPFAQMTVLFSSEVIAGAQSYFMTDTGRAQEILQKMTVAFMQRIPEYVKELIETGTTNPKAERMALSTQARFDKNVRRLVDASNITTGIEGIVFEYPPMSRRYYKFTGGFAPANQILGLLGWDEKADIMKSVRKSFNTTPTLNESSIRKIVRRVLGRFYNLL